jgi:kynureninase
MTPAASSRAACEALDAQDPLAFARTRFALPEGLIYLDGNSLGAMPYAVSQRLRDATDLEWAQGLIRSWNDAHWYTAPQRAAAKIARLIGADPDEVIVADSTSVNLFKLLMAAAHAQRTQDPSRTVLLTERGNFPTDSYLNASVADLMGMELVQVDAHELPQAIWTHRTRLAVLQLTHVHYKTGRIHDMAGLTAHAQTHGAQVLWDLAHTAGAMPVGLDALQVDFAVGCGYKYLNGGPGAPAFAYVARRHLATLTQPLVGWHGHARPFAFEEDWQPAPGIERLLCGTAPQLSLLALEVALDAFNGVDLDLLRAKSTALTSIFIEQLESAATLDAQDALALASPRTAQDRGSQVALRHPQAYAIVQALIDRGVIGDFREPDLMRFGFAPLYVRHVDAFDAARALHEVICSRTWDQPRFAQRRTVT